MKEKKGIKKSPVSLIDFMLLLCVKELFFYFSFPVTFSCSPQHRKERKEVHVFFKSKSKTRESKNFFLSFFLDTKVKIEKKTWGCRFTFNL